jgi:hypothetical protein
MSVTMLGVMGRLNEQVARQAERDPLVDEARDDAEVGAHQVIEDRVLGEAAARAVDDARTAVEPVALDAHDVARQ